MARGIAAEAASARCRPMGSASCPVARVKSARPHSAATCSCTCARSADLKPQVIRARARTRFSLRLGSRERVRARLSIHHILRLKVWRIMAGRIEPPEDGRNRQKTRREIIDSLLFWRLLAPWRFKFSRRG
jgi:hypothetical protein